MQMRDCSDERALGNSSFKRQDLYLVLRGCVGFRYRRQALGSGRHIAQTFTTSTYQLVYDR